MLYCAENSDGECEETGNLWDHFKMSALATIDSRANDAEINSARPDFTQYERAFELHTGRTLTWFAVEQGFRSIKQMLQEVLDLVISEVEGKAYVQKKPVDAVVAIVQDMSHPEDSYLHRTDFS